jgi:isocitrate dehydrogenase
MRRRRRWAGWGLRREGNVGDGYAVFEATHGTAPKYADKDVINPGSVILSGVMLFDFLGWTEAARLIESVDGEDDCAEVCDVRLRAAMEGATKAKTSEFATRMIENICNAVVSCQSSVGQSNPGN